MKMNDILREKRKLLGLTQEQVANYLGITAPAVNKWEKGLSCPDIALLPMLARLLKTDPNTLLCFKENLSDQEIGLFLNKVSETIKTMGFQQGYDLAIEEIREYPHCGKLKYNLALILEGAMLTSNSAEDDSEKYGLQIDRLYEEIAACDDEILVNNARFMLASKCLKQNEFDKAQALLDLIPQKSAIPDKQALQANLLSMQGKSGEAAVILERMALSALQETLMEVTKLIPILVSENKFSQAEQLAKASQTQYEAFGLWEYSAYLATMQLAVSKKDIPESLTVIRKMLNACVNAWDVSNCPLYLHQPRKEGSDNIGYTFLPSLLLDLESNPEYAFLQDSPAFCELIAEYQKKAVSTAFDK
ncbi:MAG: helix-turn-helix transcriptional regulator [Christensenellaceae bacterium]